ncbi:CapA family protein [Phytoactinopolyspora mesophila]|uniref:CapA family protein n=1 Tax=Phytoactinopolyspora mesophila TaxID=2650750 RepID=A0A7K3M2H2_9ACTN|nr:CapA family protein [Phytoactinopolyspora mesophila]NDL57503.1 CapA family protein [Phytoactinopolyspora mesophila]
MQVLSRARLLAVLVVFSWIAGCSGDDDASGTDPTPAVPIPTTPGADASPPPASPTPDRSPEPPRDSPTQEPHQTPRGPVTLAFAGDIHFEGHLESLLDDPDTALAPLAPVLAAADLAMVNLESAVGTGGSPEPKRFTFQAPPTAFDALAAAGVDVVTMANNHAMDFGSDGFAETLAAASEAAEADDPLSVIGIGADRDDAFAPAIHEIRGNRVAVLGASTPDDPTADPTEHWAAGDDEPGVAIALDPDPLLDAVTAARDEADVVVVYMHWGVQGERCPSDSQRTLATQLATAGADVVVGSHTHRLQGAGLLDETYVAYGLGNTVWYTQSSEAASATGVLTLTVHDGRVIDENWDPARIGDDGLPEFTEGAEARDMTSDFAELRECTDLDPGARL